MSKYPFCPQIFPCKGLSDHVGDNSLSFHASKCFTMAFTPVTAAVTLSGSLLSSIASFCVLVCFLFIRKSQRTFRHALVFNLTLAGTPSGHPSADCVGISDV